MGTSNNRFARFGGAARDGESNRSKSGGGFFLSQEFIGQSNSFKSIVDMISAIAARRCSVIISGETGVGKEMVARQLHFASDRAADIFVPVDCSTLTGSLFESQLFGHVKGAFTGAINESIGFFRAADKGTIFLDEIGEIPIELQAKLLRVLQQQAVVPVGSTKAFPIDVRVVCATNRNLSEMVEKSTFRADLYYRLNVVTLEIPPLRERKEDIMLLAEYFLKAQSDFYSEPAKDLSKDAAELIVNYGWPGNVRELANAIERAYVLTKGRVIEPSVLPYELILGESADGGSLKLPTLDEVQRKVILHTLKHTNGQKAAAASILGVERRRLNRLMEKLNISSDSN